VSLWRKTMSKVKFWFRGLCLAGMILAPSVMASDETIPLLEAGTQTYSNVTVTSKTSRYIIVSHAHGMSSIKLKDLSDDVLKQLGYAVEPPPAPKQKPGAVLFATVASDPRFKGIQEKVAQEAQDRLRELGPQFLMGILAGLGVLYLFACYCCMSICKKVGQEPGVLVWLPILKVFPMLRAAGMSGWWFIALLLPVLFPVAAVLWCVKICQARGKSGWLGVLLLLPLTNIFTFLYLAFADGASEKEATSGRITFD